MKRPEQCVDLQEIRTEIDRLDEQIIDALAERALYVAAAARFKRDRAAVADNARVDAMISSRRRWAEAKGLSPDLAEELFRKMVSHFIAEEQRQWDAQQG
jgi:isochorismate pyruvate lyase